MTYFFFFKAIKNNYNNVFNPVFPNCYHFINCESSNRYFIVFLWNSLKWDTLLLTAYLSHIACHTWLVAPSLANAAKHLLNKAWVNASLEHPKIQTTQLMGF